MATTSTTARTVAEEENESERVTGRFRSRTTEAVLGLLFVAPAVLIALIFQLLAVVYGFFISMQGGVLVPQGFIGLSNFVRAVGSLAYMIALALALVLALGGYGTYQRARLAMRQGQGNFFPYLVPGYIVAVSLLLLTFSVVSAVMDYAWLTVVGLIVAGGMYVYLNGRTRSGETSTGAGRFSYAMNSIGVALFTLLTVLLVLFVFSELRDQAGSMLALVGQLAADGRYSYVFPLGDQFAAFWGTAAAVIAALLISQTLRGLDASVKPRRVAWLRLLRFLLIVTAAGFLLYLIGAQDALNTSLNAISGLTNEQVREVTRVRLTTILEGANMWSQVFTMLMGIGFISMAAYLWFTSRRRDTTPGVVGQLLIAIFLMVGGWAFLGELPLAGATGDPEFYDSLLRTVAYAAVTVPAQLAIGLGLAYLLFYEVGRGKGLFRTVFLIPYVAPTVATATVFAMIFSLNDTSPANQIIHIFGLPSQQWLRDPRGVFQILAEIIGGPNTVLPPFLVGPSLPLVSAIIYGIWVFSGYNAVIFLAGLGNVPKDLFEAAQVDGAGRWQVFRNIIFPLLSPTTFFLTMLGVIGTFRAFSHIWVLRTPAARGAMDTTTVYVFTIIQETSVLKTRPYASALSFLLFGIILILTVIQNRMAKDRVFYG